MSEARKILERCEPYLVEWISSRRMTEHPTTFCDQLLRDLRAYLERTKEEEVAEGVIRKTREMAKRMAGVWRCSNCGDQVGVTDTRARWNGTEWEHACAGPQAGAFPCRYFGESPEEPR